MGITKGPLDSKNVSFAFHILGLYISFFYLGHVWVKHACTAVKDKYAQDMVRDLGQAYSHAYDETQYVLS